MMKKFCILTALVLGALSGVFADDATLYSRLNERRRYAETGFVITPGFANNVLSVPNLFRRRVTIDLNKVNAAVPSEGNSWNMSGDMRTFLNINPRRNWGFGHFVNMDSRADILLPKEFFRLFTEGNWSPDPNNPTLDEKEYRSQGTFTVSGAAFGEAGLRGYATMDRLRFEVSAAWFLPAMYVPKSGLTYEMDTTDRLYARISGSAAAYLPFDDEGNLTDLGGGDLSLAAEYALFRFLDLGAALKRIPIVPARLTNKMSFAVDQVFIDDDNLFDGIDDMETPDFGDSDSFSKDERWVVRPLRFDVYALFRPLNTDFVVIRPNIGFTAINPSEETYFNWGLEGQLNLGRIFSLALNTGLEEGIWRHNLGFSLDLRIIRFYLQAGLGSQDFVHSFQANGLRVSTGITVGY